MSKNVYTISDYLQFFNQGDERGFDYFFREYYKALCLFSIKITHDNDVAEEITSAAFIKTWEKRNTFVSPKSLKSYLYQVVKNDAISFIRKQKKETEITLAFNYSDAEESNALNAMIHAECVREINSTMQHLPEKCRTIFSKLYIEGMTVAEVADELQLSKSTVKTQKAIGLSIFRKKFSY